MKKFNFFVNRIFANTPPVVFKGASRFVWVLVLMLITIGVGQVWGAGAPVNTVLWGETFDHFYDTSGKKPSEAGTGTGTTIYDNASISYTQSSNNTKGYNEVLAGGTAPELLLYKSNTTWTISNIKTGGATGMSLTFKSNKTTFDVTVSSNKLAVSGSQKSWTISLKSGQTDPGTFNITIKNTGSSNARIDDIVLKVTTAGSSKTDLTLDLSYSPNPIILGENASSSPTLTGNTGNGTVTYSLENVSPAGCMTINSSTGAISPVAVGTAKAVASVAETTNYNAGTKKCDVSVVKKYTVTLGDDASSLTETTVGGGVTLPSRTGCTGYTFEGWTKSWNSAQTEWTTTAPTIIPAGSYTPEGDENLYPVYTKTESGGTIYQFQKVTTLSQINAGGTFIITNGSYYLPNGAATNAGPSVASMVTVTNGVVTGTVTDAMKWTFSAADANNRVTIRSVANSNNYLYTISDGNGVRVSTQSDSWTFEEYTVSSILGFAMKSTSQNRYCAVYSTSNWRSYTTKNASNYSQNSGRLDLYKYTEVSSSTTSYISVPNCCTAHDVNITTPSNGSVTTDKDEACEGVSVTLTITPNTGYQLSALTVGGNNVTASVSDGKYTFSMPNADVAVSATFAAKHHNVVFHKNDGSDATNTQDYTFGVAQNLKTISTIGWSRTNYNFGGWMNASNGESADFADGASYTLSVDNNVDLYALWVADNTRTIAYSGDEHINYSSKPTSVMANATNFAASFTLAEGYELKGVTATMGGEAIAANKIAFDQTSLTITAPTGGFTDNIAVTFNVAEIKYTVTFHAGTGTCGTESMTQASYGAAIELPSATIGAQGWSFVGWAEASVASATSVEPTLYTESFTPAADDDLYAVYRKTITEGGTSQVKMSYGSIEGWTLSEGVSGSSYYFLEKDEYIESPEIADMSAISSIKVTVGAYNNAGAYKIEAGGTQIISDTKPSSSSVDRTYNVTTDFSALSGTGKIRLTNTDGVVKSNSQPSGTRMHAMTINIDVAAVYSYHSTPASATGLAVQVAPTKTVYKVGDTFDPAGTTLRVTYSNSTTEDITSGFTYSPTTALTKENTSVTFSYLGLNCNQTISVLDPVATPTFSPASGSEVSVSETITISCETASATIYYTTDGSDPTNTSAVYSTPIAPYSTIKAIAMKAGMAPSEIATATYTVVKNSQTLSFTNSSYSFRLNSDEYNAFEHQAVSGAQTIVTYSSNKTSVADVENGVIVLKGGKGTATITATAAETAIYSSASATYTITVLREGATRTGDFQLVTDASQLEDGDYILLTSETSSYSSTAEVFSGVTSSAGTHQSKTVANDEITYSQLLAEGNTAKIIYLEKFGDYWAFNYGSDNDIYIAAGTGTGSGAAELRGLEEIDDYCKWTISIGEGNVANVNNKGNTTYYALSYNTQGAGAFKAYKNLQSGSLRIYKQKDKNKLPQTLSFATPSYEFPLNESAYTSFVHQVVSGANTAVTYTTSNSEVAAINNNTVVLNGGVGTATITATAAESEDYEHASATYTITVTAALNTVTFHYYKAADATADQTALKEESSGAGITVPAKPANVGEYTFLGWAPGTLVETQTAPDNLVAVLQAGATYHPATNEEYHAIYRRLENSDGRFYLMHEVNSTPNYAKAPASSTSTNFQNTTTIGEAAIFEITEDNKLFYYEGNTPRYFSSTSTTARDIDFTTNAEDAQTWTITESGTTTTFYSSISEKYFAHNSTMWAAYASGSINQANQSKDLKQVYLAHVYYSSTPNLMVSPVLTWAQGNATHVMEIEETYDNAATATVSGEPVSVTYSSSDETKATVNNAGVVTAHLGGLVTITATVAENPGVSRQLVETYQVSITKKVPQITFDDAANWKVYVGEAYKRVLAGQVTITTDGAVTYTLSNNATSSDWASINSTTGEVTGLSTGGQSSKYQYFYVHTAETDMYQAGEAYKQFNVLALKNQTLTFDQNAYVYEMNESVAPFVNTLSGAMTTVTYASDNTSVAEVNATSGEVTVHTNVRGTATITATAAEGQVGDDVYKQVSQMYTITVNYPKPIISVATCDFKAPFDVTLSANAADVEMIVYTLDGNEPSYSGSVGDIYTEPITINATKTLKAIAVSNDEVESPVASATYTKLTPALTAWSFENGAYVAVGTEQTITASEGAKVTYIISQGGVEVASATSEGNVATFSFAEAGNYQVEAEAQWNVANGFVCTSVSRTVHVKGAVHLPISYDGNGAGISSEPYFSVEGAALGDYANYSNAPIQVKGNTILTIAFLDEPSNVVFYAGKNGSPWTSTLNLQESADGLTFEDVKTFNDGDLEFSNTGYGNNNGGTKQNLNLKSTTRFVRWNYTKVNGNVALGKIAIYPKSMEPDNEYSVPVDFTGDVVVEDGVAWNIIEEQTINNLTVKQGAEVWNYEAITVNNLFLEAQEGKSGQITEDESITINGNAYYDLTLNTSGTMDNSKWYSFAVPFPVDAATGIQRLSNDGQTSNAGFNSHYVLLKYNSAAYASSGQGWEYVTRGDILMPGKFYMIALNSNVYNRVRMTKKTGTPLNNKAELSLTLVGEGAHANWNALANNALAYANVNATGANAGLKVQVYNSATDNYTPLGFSEVTFTVGTPFFFQAAEAGTMSVEITTSSNATVKAPQREAVTTEEFQLRLGANTESYYDILYVSASDEALNDYQIGHDLVKAGVSTTVPQMYVQAYGVKLCDAEFPLVNNEATFPLTFTAPNAGTFQLYVVTAAQNAELYLMQNNNIIWNLTQSPYEIELPQGTTEGYSLLLRANAPGTGTGVDEIHASKVAQKVVINDHVYILRGGQMYDVNGKAVK